MKTCNAMNTIPALTKKTQANLRKHLKCVLPIQLISWTSPKVPHSFPKIRSSDERFALPFVESQVEVHM